MTDKLKIAMLQTMTGETDINTLSVYLALAKNIVLAKAYPYAETLPEMPEKYDSVQVEIAAFMLNKRGAEGETAHSENGVSRSYENSDIPSRLICRITPVASPIIHTVNEEVGKDEASQTQPEDDTLLPVQGG